jgi:hypothetical protein
VGYPVMDNELMLRENFKKTNFITFRFKKYGAPASKEKREPRKNVKKKMSRTKQKKLARPKQKVKKKKKE